MFWTSKFSFDEDILAFLVWQLFWLLFEKLDYFFKSFGHPGEFYYAQCRYSQCNHAESHHSECCYSKCHSTDRQSAFQKFWQTFWKKICSNCCEFWPPCKIESRNEKRLFAELNFVLDCCQFDHCAKLSKNNLSNFLANAILLSSLQGNSNNQGTLTEGKGSVQLTSSLRQLVL